MGHERLLAGLALAFFILLPACAAYTATAAAPARSKAPASAQAPSCADMLDSLSALEADNHGDYIAWDLESHGCDRAQLYRGYLRQGVALALADSWEGAVHALLLAKEIGGPDDEELLYHLWSSLRRLDRRKEMGAAARELYQRYPSSPYLAMVLEDWRRDGKPRAGNKAWKATFESRFARSRVGLLDNVQSNRLKGEAGQSLGDHGFREYGSVSLKSRLGGSLLDAFQAELGAEWQWRGLSLEAEWALGYDVRNAGDTLLADLTGSGSDARWSGWNGRMGQMAATWMSAPGDGYALALRADARLFSRTWWAAGASVSPTWFSGPWSLTGLLDWHEHAVDWEFKQTETLEGGEIVDLAYVMDGMRTVQASLSPGWRAGSHDLSLGLGYFLVRTSNAFRIGFEGVVDEEKGASWEHSVALNPAWRYTWRKRLRLDLGLGFGYDFDEKTASSPPACGEWLPGYCADETYSAEAGFSIAF